MQYPSLCVEVFGPTVVFCWASIARASTYTFFPRADSYGKQASLRTIRARPSVAQHLIPRSSLGGITILSVSNFPACVQYAPGAIVGHRPNEGRFVAFEAPLSQQIANQYSPRPLPPLPLRPPRFLRSQLPLKPRPP